MGDIARSHVCAFALNAVSVYPSHAVCEGDPFRNSALAQGAVASLAVMNHLSRAVLASVALLGLGACSRPSSSGDEMSRAERGALPEIDASPAPAASSESVLQLPSSASAPPPAVKAPSTSESDWRDMVKIPGSAAMDVLWIDRTEVTVGAYAACVKRGDCEAPTTDGVAEEWKPYCNWGKESRLRDPINCVRWDEASSYCAAMGKRLPTEQEWERAATGGTKRVFPWGNGALNGRRACWDRYDYKRNQGEGTCPVGSHPAGASPHGLQDMAGNVWEWTASKYDDASEARVDRGGCWYSFIPSRLHVSHRDRQAPSVRDSRTGFRCARSSPAMR